MIPKYVVILQNELDFRWKHRTVVALATSTLKGKAYPWNVLVATGTFEGFPVETLIVCSDLYLPRVATVRGGRYLGQLPKEVMQEVDEAIAVSLGLLGTPPDAPDSSQDEDDLEF